MISLIPILLAVMATGHWENLTLVAPTQDVDYEFVFEGETNDPPSCIFYWEEETLLDLRAVAFFTDKDFWDDWGLPKDIARPNLLMAQAVEEEVGVPSGWHLIDPSDAFETVTLDQDLGTSMVTRFRVIYSLTDDGATTRTVPTQVRIRVKGEPRQVRRLKKGVRMFHGEPYINQRFLREREKARLERAGAVVR